MLLKSCPDIRNSRAIDIYRELKEYSIKTIAEYPEGNGYGAIILAVAHKEFLSIDLNVQKNYGAIIYDVKEILDKQLTNGRL